MRRLMLSVCVMVLAAGAVPAFAESKIAVVNLREILTKCDVGAKAVTDMRAIFTPRQQKLAEMKQEALAMQSQLKAKAQDNPSKSAELDAKIKKYAEEDAQLRKDLAAEEETRLKPITDKVTAVIKAYAKEKGLYGVQDRSVYLYSDPAMDATDEIIKRVNQAK